jgi:hypothetical protein
VKFFIQWFFKDKQILFNNKVKVYYENMHFVKIYYYILKKQKCYSVQCFIDILTTQWQVARNCNSRRQIFFLNFCFISKKVSEKCNFRTKKNLLIYCHLPSIIFIWCRNIKYIMPASGFFMLDVSPQNESLLEKKSSKWVMAIVLFDG